MGEQRKARLLSPNEQPSTLHAATHRGRHRRHAQQRGAARVEEEDGNVQRRKAAADDVDAQHGVLGRQQAVDHPRRKVARLAQRRQVRQLGDGRAAEDDEEHGRQLRREQAHGEHRARYRQPVFERVVGRHGGGKGGREPRWPLRALGTAPRHEDGSTRRDPTVAAATTTTDLERETTKQPAA